MAEFLSSPLASFVFLLTLTAVLVAIGVYVIGIVRCGMKEREPKSSEYLTKFQELHAQGELEDEEFRTIKAMLATRLQQELAKTENNPPQDSVPSQTREPRQSDPG